MLNSDKELDLTSESPPLASKVAAIFAEEDSLEFVSSMSESAAHEEVSSSISGDKPYEELQRFQDLALEVCVKMTSEENFSAYQKSIAAVDKELRDPGGAASSSSGDENFASPAPVQTVADLILSKIAEVHRVSQDIKSLRSMPKLPLSTNSSVCACGDDDCSEAWDIQEWLRTSKSECKMCKLGCLLGESGLALSQAYKKNDQLHQALKVARLACSIYGSMHQHLEETKFISSMVSERNEQTRAYSVGAKYDKSSSADDSLTFDLFWARAWTLVGDVYVEFKYCSSCSSVNCSCPGDRISRCSGASSSGGSSTNDDKPSVAKGRKQGKKSDAKSMSSLLGDPAHHHKHGIYKYLGDLSLKDEYQIYSDALSCYEEAIKTLGRLPSGSTELLQDVLKKKGGAYNELGCTWLARNNFTKAEICFAQAMAAFKEVSDHINVIWVNMNLGHGRRLFAEKMSLETAVVQYWESLKCYEAAKSELYFVPRDTDLRNKVYEQFANTYLMLGMRLANDVTEEVLTSPSERKRREERSKKNLAEDSICMALTLFESLGESFKQQAAYAHFQLGCYYRNCSLKLLEFGHKKRDSSEGVLEQYVSLAKRSWQSALEFYGPQAHPHMYLTILMERSDLLLRLSGPAVSSWTLIDVNIYICISHSPHFETVMF